MRKLLYITFIFFITCTSEKDKGFVETDFNVDFTTNIKSEYGFSVVLFIHEIEKELGTCAVPSLKLNKEVMDSLKIVNYIKSRYIDQKGENDYLSISFTVLKSTRLSKLMRIIEISEAVVSEHFNNFSGTLEINIRFSLNNDKYLNIPSPPQ
jgi:hypothetical protein